MDAPLEEPEQQEQSPMHQVDHIVIRITTLDPITGDTMEDSIVLGIGVGGIILASGAIIIVPGIIHQCTSVAV